MVLVDRGRKAHRRASLPCSRCRAHESADEVLPHFPAVKAAFAPDEVVTDTGKRNNVDPGEVVSSQLQGCRGKGGRNVGVERVARRVV